MLITAPAIAALQTTFSTIFRTAYQEADPFWSKVASLIPSSTSLNTYGWMAQILAMREWVGPRVLQNLNSHAYTLPNATYEATIQVGREEIEDDMLGVFNLRMQELGAAAAQWPDDRVAAAIQAGTTSTTFEGAVTFFSTVHPLDPNAAGGVQSNNFTSTPLTAATFETVSEAMECYTGEGSRNLNVKPKLLVVPPQLKGVARRILNAELLPSAAGTASETNILRGSADLLVIPELCNEATTWYLLDTTKPIKPFIWQLRRAVQLVSKTQPTEDGVFFDNQFLWGVDGRGQSGYGPWWLAARAIA